MFDQANHLTLSPFRRKASQIHHREFEPLNRRDDLNRLSAPVRTSGSQNLVAPDDLFKSAPERVGIERSAHPERQHASERALLLGNRYELLGKPESGLRI
jgi:hypothetical protein